MLFSKGCHCSVPLPQGGSVEIQAFQIGQQGEIVVHVEPEELAEIDLSDAVGVGRSDGVREVLEHLTASECIEVPVRAEDVLAVVDRGYFVVQLAACEGDCEQGSLPWLIVVLVDLCRIAGSQPGGGRFGVDHVIAEGDVAVLDDDVSPDAVANLGREFKEGKGFGDGRIDHFGCRHSLRWTKA